MYSGASLPLGGANSNKRWMHCEIMGVVVWWHLLCWSLKTKCVLCGSLLLAHWLQRENQKHTWIAVGSRRKRRRRETRDPRETHRQLHQSWKSGRWQRPRTAASWQLSSPVHGPPVHGCCHGNAWRQWWRLSVPCPGREYWTHSEVECLKSKYALFILQFTANLFSICPSGLFPSQLFVLRFTFRCRKTWRRTKIKTKVYPLNTKEQLLECLF